MICFSGVLMMSDVLEHTDLPDLPALPPMTVLDNPIIYWLKRDLWTKEQAASLLTYLDPREGAQNDYERRDAAEMEDLIECSVAIETLKVDHSNFENSIAFIPLNIVKWAINKELPDIPKLLLDWYEVESIKKPLMRENDVIDQNYISENLAILNQAARKFWANADPEDKETHPKNEAVEEWLTEEGLPKTYAPQAATIIRPKWGAKGRR